MRNSLIDLNNHLFCQLERLSDEGLSDDELSKEIMRANSVAEISSEIIKNAAVMLKANELRLEYGLSINDTPKLFSDK